jgi:hypothetical protein
LIINIWAWKKGWFFLVKNFGKFLNKNGIMGAVNGCYVARRQESVTRGQAGAVF